MFRARGAGRAGAAPHAWHGGAVESGGARKSSGQGRRRDVAAGCSVPGLLTAAADHR